MRLFFSSLLLFCSSLIIAQECPTPLEVNEECLTITEECLTLTLETAISRALNFNRQFINTLESQTRSEYSVIMADSEFDIKIVPDGQAGYIGGGRDGAGPSVGGGVRLGKKFRTGTSISINPSIIKEAHHFQNNVKTLITQPLLRGLGSEYQLSGLRGAQFSFRTCLRDIYNARVQLILRTIRSLYDIIKAQKSVELNQESYTRIKKFYDAAKLKERIGLADALDIYRAQVELEQAEDNLKNALERSLDAEDQIRDLLSLSLDTCIKISVPVKFTQNLLTEDEVYCFALANRVEIDQAMDQVDENKRLKKIAENNLYPQLDLILNYSNVGTDQVFTNSWRRRESTWGVGFKTSTDVNPVADKIAYEKSIVAIKNSERNLEQVQANIYLDVKKNLRQLARAFERIHLEEKQIKTAQGQLYLSKIKFDRGMANNFDVIQAEKTFRSAQIAYWTAIIDHIVGEFQLRIAAGLLIDKPCI